MPHRLHDDHIYGGVCALIWLNNNHTCPICRKVLFRKYDVDTTKLMQQARSLAYENEDDITGQLRIQDDAAHLQTLRKQIQRVELAESEDDEAFVEFAEPILTDITRSRGIWYVDNVSSVADDRYGPYTPGHLNPAMDPSISLPVQSNKLEESLREIWRRRFHSAILAERPTAACHPIAVYAIVGLLNALRTLDGKSMSPLAL